MKDELTRCPVLCVSATPDSPWKTQVGYARAQLVESIVWRERTIDWTHCTHFECPTHDWYCINCSKREDINLGLYFYSWEEENSVKCFWKFKPETQATLSSWIVSKPRIIKKNP